MEANYQILIRKLDEFIRKYYKNQLIRGGLYAIATVVALFITINLLEYFAYFSTVVRAILFWSFIGTNIFILVRFIGIPLFKLFRIGQTLTHEDAARVIGKHFSGINDVLLNTLQLRGMMDHDQGNRSLIEAGIGQKIARLRPIPFTAAIDLKKNRKYLRYAVPPVLVLLILIIAAPGVITAPTNRLVDYTTYYEKPAPFQFNITNERLEALQQTDFVLNVKMSGEEVPNEVFIVIGESSFRLTKESAVLFHHSFNNLQRDVNFYLKAGSFRSKDYLLKVIARPSILNFQLELDYPDYIGKKDEILENSGDIVVPCGTTVTWRMYTRDTRDVVFHFPEKTIKAKADQANVFLYRQQCRVSQTYSVKTSNQFMSNPDSMQFAISVIEDQFPGIKVEAVKDSVYDKRMYFTGNIHDDYGCSKLLFKYRIWRNNQENGEGEKEKSSEVQIINGTTQQQFYYFYDLADLEIGPGDKVEYYFEVWDNDGVNGSKATRTLKMIFKAPTLEELQQQTEKTNEQIKDEMEDAMRQTEQLQRELDKLDRKLTDKKNLSWQEKKEIQDILNRQQELQTRIEQLRLENQTNNVRQNEYKEPDPLLIEKQKMLEKLFDEVMTDEMKELLRQLQEMIDKLDKKQVNEMIDKMKLTNEDINKQLDRNLELFKQLEFEKKLQETIDQLRELAEEQKKLSEESKSEKSNTQELLNKQNELNKEFDQVRKDLNDLEAKNKELEVPKNMENTDSLEQSIQQEMQESSEQLGNNKKGNASKSQKSAGDQMEQLADQLQQAQEEEEEEESIMNEQALRQILENLVFVSKAQEEIMKQFSRMNVSDPKYIKFMDKQKELQDGIKLIEDSLYALSKREPAIETYILRAMADINQEEKKVLETLHNRNTAGAQSHQQMVMKKVNDLALLLSEVLNQMNEQQQQCNSGKSGKKGNCKKPGSGKPSAGSMKALQEQLNKQLQEMKGKLEGQKPGMKAGSGQQSMSEQLARLAAEQEMLRKMLQEYGEEDKLNGGKNSGDISQMLKDMEETERDIVNKMITNETLKRQQDILTRLLESEKAEKERDLDEKRESSNPKNQNYSNPNEFFKYNRIKSQEMELLKTVPPTMNSFYKQKVNEYFYNFVE